MAPAYLPDEPARAGPTARREGRGSVLVREVPAAAPAWRDPATWRLGRVWQFWLLAMLTLGGLCLAFGSDRVAAGLRDAWPWDLRSDPRP